MYTIKGYDNRIKDEKEDVMSYPYSHPNEWYDIVGEGWNSLISVESKLARLEDLFDRTLADKTWEELPRDVKQYLIDQEQEHLEGKYAEPEYMPEEE